MNTELLLIVGILGFVFFILNVIFLAILFFMRRRMAVVRQWPSTMGTVNASYLERRSSSEGGYTNYPVSAICLSSEWTGLPGNEGRTGPRGRRHRRGNGGGSLSRRRAGDGLLQPPESIRCGARDKSSRAMDPVAYIDCFRYSVIWGDSDCLVVDESIALLCRSCSSLFE